MRNAPASAWLWAAADLLFAVPEGAEPVTTFLTLNTYLFDLRVLGLPLQRPAPYVRERLAALPDALRGVAADVVCLQEVFRHRHRALLQGSLADLYPYSAGVEARPLRFGTGLMVLSRFPIESSRSRLFRRRFLEERIIVYSGMLHCVLTVPGLGRCHVFDIHATAGGIGRHPESTAAEACRGAQIDEIVSLAKAHSDDVAVVAGDLNAGPHASPANYRQMLDGGFVDRCRPPNGGSPSSSPLDVTWDPQNPLVADGPEARLAPQRIDHVFARGRGPGACAVRSARVVFDEPSVRVGSDRRVPLSDHYGVLADVERLQPTQA